MLISILLKKLLIQGVFRWQPIQYHTCHLLISFQHAYDTASKKKFVKDGLDLFPSLTCPVRILLRVYSDLTKQLGTKDLQNCRGKKDYTQNVTENFQTVQRHILRENFQHIRVVCGRHSLNLTGVMAVKCYIEGGKCFFLIDLFFFFLNFLMQMIYCVY